MAASLADLGAARVRREPPAEERARGRRLAGPTLFILAAVLFLGFGSRTISAPFGDSHDGRNAGVWAAGSRSLRESGPIASWLGTRSPEIGVYANHPPLIYLETALAELVGAHSTASTRAPAWLGSVVALALVARLLRQRGLHPIAAGLAALLVAATPMFLVFGTMLDTPVTSLPFGVGLLLVWERARAGHTVRPLLAGMLAALAVLAGWQSLLLAGLISGWAVVRVLRRRGRREVEVAFAIGGLAGAAIVLAWLLWAFDGTLRPLVDQFRFRTGVSAESARIGTVLAAQRRDMRALFGVVGLLAVAGLVAALRDRRTRGLALVALAVTVPYPLLFRSGAVNHNYWGYWFVLPLAIGFGAGADRLLVYWRSSGRRESVLAVAGAVMGTVLIGGAWVVMPHAEWQKVESIRAAHATADVSLDPAQ
ncbi:MAG: glycosyltransferase family 39 protein, partial [Acidimicrobiales bacterium]